MHFGRRRAVFHPGMKQYVYSSRENICIIDLTKTLEALNEAVAEMKKVIAAGGVILFVGVNKYSSDAVKKAAVALNMPYVVERWLGGTMTNFKVITSRVKYLENLEMEKLENGFAKYTKKERILKDREILKMKEKYDGIRNFQKIPEIIFVSSLRDSETAIREAKRMKVKAIGIVNTDSDPKSLNFAIPANDNSARSIEMILDIIVKNLSLK
ncbi:MAG: small subunit ribosomal protein S2 [Parcubacteria group bacterium Licking1014_17]|nr:MAG: small subunit ribosomal protein S2 [Parcubacteria group bacterium Licking1014_17]